MLGYTVSLSQPWWHETLVSVCLSQDQNLVSLTIVGLPGLLDVVVLER